MDTAIDLMVASLPLRRSLALADTFGGDNSAFWAGTKAEIARRLSGGRSLAVIARTREGKPVCWAIFDANRIDSSSWRYGNLATDPEYQRRGIATAVVQFGMARIGEVGGQRLYCYIDDTNTASIATHNRLGFRRNGLKKSISTLRPAWAKATSGVLADATLTRRLTTHSSALRHRDAADTKDILQFLLPRNSLLPWKRPSGRNVVFQSTDGTFFLSYVIGDSMIILPLVDTKGFDDEPNLGSEIADGATRFAWFHDDELSYENSSHCFSIYVRDL